MVDYNKLMKVVLTNKKIYIKIKLNWFAYMECICIFVMQKGNNHYIKLKTMTTQKFLSENRSTVINFFNDEIKNNWNISIKDFMIDLMNNFKKVTIVEDFTKTDLKFNLIEAKSRLGLFDNKVEVLFDRDAYIAKKYQNTVFAQNLAL